MQITPIRELYITFLLFGCGYVLDGMLQVSVTTPVRAVHCRTAANYRCDSLKCEHDIPYQLHLSEHLSLCRC